MIIDAHNHPDWHGYNRTRFLANMKQHDIDKTWLLSWEAPQDECSPVYYKCCPQVSTTGPIAFARCLSYVERAPDKFVLGYAPDPRRPEAVDQLEAAIETYGVRVYGELKLRMMFDNPDAIRMYRFCGEKGLPVIVHIDYDFAEGSAYPRPGYWYGGGIQPFERALAACPETVFMGHGPGFWAHISGDDQFDKAPYPTGPVQPDGDLVRLMHTYPNLYADLSAGSGCNALERDPEFAKDFLLEFQDRLCFGRDCFDDRLRKFLDGAGLPDDVLDKIFAGNALKLVPL